jgi:hypothetical protein
MDMNYQYFKSVDLPGIDTISQEVQNLLANSDEPEIKHGKRYRFWGLDPVLFESCATMVHTVEQICSWREVKYVAIVTTPPGMGNIHSDYSPFSQIVPVHLRKAKMKNTGTLEPPWALNFPITNCDESFTAYYKLKPGRTANIRYVAESALPLITYDLDDVEEVDRFYMNGRAAIFNTQEIHCAHNPTPQDRVVMTVRFNTNLADLGWI